MTSDIETGGSAEVPVSEVALLTRRLQTLGIDSGEIEKVVAEAVLLFGEGRPEHEVEKIIGDYLQTEADKIAAAEAEADKQAA